MYNCADMHICDCCLCACMRTHIHTFIGSSIQAYMHTHMHTCIHTCRLINAQCSLRTYGCGFRVARCLPFISGVIQGSFRVYGFGPFPGSFVFPCARFDVGHAVSFGLQVAGLIRWFRCLRCLGSLSKPADSHLYKGSRRAHESLEVQTSKISRGLGFRVYRVRV